ncbi:MAG: hypothetical protein K8T91_04120 [Planctomycetes bacterium]|nr:hypothetical protein [Planctomycetota bacterium]
MEDNPYQSPETLERAAPARPAWHLGLFLARFFLSLIGVFSIVISASFQFAIRNLLWATFWVAVG